MFHMNLAFAEARILAEEFGVWERAVDLGSTTRWSVLYWAHELVKQAKSGGPPTILDLGPFIEVDAEQQTDIRQVPTLEQVEEKLVLCIAQSNAASYEKRRRRAERRAR
jgi:hypothetical protein